MKNLLAKLFQRELVTSRKCAEFTFGHISGAHVNPAITVGSVILGTKTLVQAGTYIIAQYVGSILGFGLLKLVTPANMLRYSPKAPEADFCINALSDGVSVTRGLFLEFLATMILLIVAGAFWDQRNHNNTDSVPLKFGLCVCCLAFVFGPWTSCGMNPARSFAPAVWNGVWKDQWLFWLGPYTGAIAGASLYRVVFGVKKEMTYDIPEAIALNHIDGEKSENV
ncbi:aquaporin AQPAe.a isoform X2 [Fopius arisanus]|uniref:Aquaporin AQPAe.a isoform X2 n=1 Tax=Fopius arisanus TaxID=64838 RepID=A0A9R1TKK4_9HYME|nr:PREDICTED: aquaporin AQPAe.a-like isoform X2 [Fopius arisanus]